MSAVGEPAGRVPGAERAARVAGRIGAPRCFT